MSCTKIIGIISYEEYKRRTMAIAQGTYRPKPGEPKIWFESLETMVKVLNSKNQQLLTGHSRHNFNAKG